ncbi:MAG: hypothetical protein KatS3mg131_1198 [Candidatus Tectimicrobiota bacterium]|nr:MAG: hypothetical protein KatS3mg131_1198 [Candidatus Tectomicrobia bacterium]
MSAPEHVCPFLGERNNDRTFYPMPHRRNACYARLRWRWSWRLLRGALSPVAIEKAHQARYCFGEYTACPYFRLPETPPPLVSNHEAAPSVAATPYPASDEGRSRSSRAVR